MKIIIALIQALLFVVSSFSVKDSNFKFWVDRAAINIASTSDVSFEPMTAPELAISEKEKERCREWYDYHVLGSEDPAYNFRYGIKTFANNTDDWTFEVSPESAVGEVYKGGKTSYVTAAHKDNGLVATVEATIYEEYATCEWTLSLTNTAHGDSVKITDFHGAECIVPTGRSKLYFTTGSEPAADDFQLMETFLTVLPTKFTANGGRSESALPYFNVCGEDDGAVVSVGWSGQWYTSLALKGTGVEVIAKQDVLSGALHADESIRAPLVTVSFYDGDNAIKGFNTYREWTLDCVYPEGTKGLTTGGLGNEFSTTTAQTMIDSIRSSPVEYTDRLDAYWLDAGWYEITNNNWGDSVGTWRADPNRYPDGLKAVSDAAAERGVLLLAWYEPERCCEGTVVYNECIQHDQWLIQQDYEHNMVNFGNEGAFEYITDVILESVRDNGVGVFRIDSLPAPYVYWEQADEMWEDGRKGFTENHYVTNLYRFLDALLAEGLLIDNCCSGGKRIDAEMSRRSITLWRSDYNCGDENGVVKDDIVEATQSFTYGLAFWLPYSGGTAYVSGEYADRTNILPCAQQVGYEDVRCYMNGRYFPMTYGGLDLTSYHAMQYDIGDGTQGVALIYKRENVTDNSYTAFFSGLDPDRSYSVYDYDIPEEILVKTGRELMEDGLELEITETPKAVIICYKAI